MHEHEIHAMPCMAIRSATEHVTDLVQATTTEVGARVVAAALFDHVDDLDAHRAREVGEFGRVFFTAHHEDGTTPGMVGAGSPKKHAPGAGQHVPLRHHSELGVSAIRPMDGPSA